MQNIHDLANTVVWWSFGLAFIFGFVANKTHFCTMGAISDVVTMGSWSRMRMWLLAIAIAIIGAQTLQLLGYLDLSKSIYLTPKFSWLSYIVGGVLFGIGMVLGSGCGSKTLIRIGGGNLKSLVVFIFLAVSAYLSLRGIFGIWRINYLDSFAIDLVRFDLAGQDLPALVSKVFQSDLKNMQILISALISGGLLVFIFSNRAFREFDYILGGAVIGLLITAGWYVSGHIGFVSEHPDTLRAAFIATNSGKAESFSFVGPLAYTLELLMFWSDTSKIVTFGIAAVLGVVCGSLIYAILSKSFRWEGFTSVEDTANHILGGILMGFGGITALGCTIGQGITGFSTLALGSLITLLSIIAGAVIGIRYQDWKISQKTSS